MQDSLEYLGELLYYFVDAPALPLCCVYLYSITHGLSFILQEGGGLASTGGVAPVFIMFLNAYVAVKN